MTKRSKKGRTRWHDEDWSDWDEVYEERIYSSGKSPKRLRRNKIDGVFGGVCAGLGDYFGLDPVIVRVITVLSFFFTGITIFIYFLLWMFVPSDKRAPYHREYREARKAERKKKKGKSSEPVRPLRTATFRDVKSKYRSLETRMQDLERSITSSEWKLRREFRDLEN